MGAIQLNEGTVNAYAELLKNPVKHGLNFQPIDKCFVKSDEITAKHILYEQFINYLKKPLPKVFFYLTMDDVFGICTDKDSNGYAGYKLKLDNEFLNEVTVECSEIEP